jgi:hypothetical protein
LIFLVGVVLGVFVRPRIVPRLSGQRRIVSQVHSFVTSRGLFCGGNHDRRIARGERLCAVLCVIVFRGVTLGLGVKAMAQTAGTGAIGATLQ